MYFFTTYFEEVSLYYTPYTGNIYLEGIKPIYNIYCIDVFQAKLNSMR